MRRPYKIILIVAAVITLLVVAVILFISPIAKHLVEKYDVKYTGREITMSRAYVNPFTGYVAFHNLNIYEYESDSVFISADKLSVNLAMLKLLSKEYELTEATLDAPVFHVFQHKKSFNFDDLIAKFSKKDTAQAKKEPLHLSVLNIGILDGVIHYDEDLTPVKYSIKNADFKSDGWRWNVDTLPVNFSFSSGMGTGEIEGEITLNMESMDYRLAVNVENFDLELINQYVKDLTNYGTLAAILDASIRSSGNFKTVDSLSTTGRIKITDFHFGKDKDEDYASFDKLEVAINEVSPKKMVFHYDSIVLTKPFFKYERYDRLDNIQTMFGKDGKNVKEVNADPDQFNLVLKIAETIQQISKKFLRSHYKINHFAIEDGDIQYNDYTLGDKFTAGLNPFNVTADSIDKNHNRVEVKLNTGIKPYGDFNASLSINPQDSSYFDLYYHMEKIPLTMFNPYLIEYTSFPLDRGALEFDGNAHVRAGNINSKNHLIILDPRLTSRVRNKDANWIPTPIVMAFVRERGNVIDYEIPIKGDLKDPKFNIWDVVLDVVKNIFVKPATTPYRMEVKTVERELEKSLNITWDMQVSELTDAQKSFLDKMSRFLSENPEAELDVKPMLYAKKEMEFILLFEAKKKFYLASRNRGPEETLSEQDSLTVIKMSVKNKGFVDYLNAQMPDSVNLFTVQHKAAMIITQAHVEAKYNDLLERRKRSFLAEFEKDKVADRVKFADGEQTVPFNGFAYYDITYDGDFPDYLRKAFNKMNELDSKKPRKKYKELREENNTKPQVP